ncbi:MAG: SDR family NAD(P)-dependent oxidoreductase, partial [Thiohalocapsa sp.]
AALANAGMGADEIDYIEAHGTGTALGDPIEMHALASVFAGRERPLWVGSVKSNIGHAEAAAGVAGLVKAVLMLRHGAVPASLHFRRLNPHIDLQGVPIAVPTALSAQPELRAVGVSSFGFSGTNAHLVVTAPPETAAAPAGSEATPPLLLISARTPSALRELMARYRALLQEGAAFADVCHSAAVGRARLPWWVCVGSPDELDNAAPSDAPPPEFPIPAGRRIALPLTPFERLPYWATPRPLTAGSGQSNTLLGRRLRSALPVMQYETVLAEGEPGWLADHRLHGEVVVPASMLAVMLLLALPADVATAAELTDVQFLRLLKPAERPVVQTVADPASRQLRVLAAPAGDDAAFVEIAAANWRPAAGEAPSSLPSTALRPLGTAALYAAFAAAGLDYGPQFRLLHSLAGGDGIAVTELAEGDPYYRLDPRLLDAAWQSLAAALPEGSGKALVPAGLDRLVVVGDGMPRRSVLRLTAPDRADVTLYDGEGHLVAHCGGLRLATLSRAAASAVVQLPAWQAVAAGSETPAWIDCRGERDAAAACWRVIEAYRALPDGPAPPRLAVLANGATDVGGRTPVPAQAALAGLVRSLALERPELRPVLLDLEASAMPPPVPEEAPEPVLAWHQGQLFAPRLQAQALPSPPAAPFVLARPSSATLDALEWQPLKRRAPGPGEVEIEVTAAGVNFRDLMNLLGAYPGDGGAPGGECAGTIVAIGANVGPDVHRLEVGDAVVAIAPGCLASHVLADARLVCPIPASVDWRALAAQPVALLTARLALDEIARIKRGQRVLIHAATGGVGLAAVALAQHRGAEIVATAGNAVKRDHLAALGIREIHDSRSLAFAAAAPVDIVLNSLTGEAIPAGLALLKPGGIFLELGKAEIWPQERVRALRADVSYVAVALDRLILDEPERVGAMLREEIESIAGLAHGAAAMLPIRSHPFATIGEALRTMQSARHIGKLVLSRTRLRGDGVYIVSGGTGGIGRHLVHWLAERGARQILVLARRLRPVTAPGAEVIVKALDIADERAVRQALSGLRRPIKGVFHLAGELHDATAANLTRAQLDAALSAKLRGAEVLDRLTRGHQLDLFVLFGSLAGVTGAAGQANYAAANATLDALAQARRAAGLPALAVDWGAWQGEGMAAGRSFPALPPALALDALDWALASELTQAAISLGDSVVGSAPPRPTANFAAQLAAAVGSAKLDVLVAAVDATIRPILGLGDLPLERERPLAELGLDSLMAVELRNALGRLTGRVLPTSLVFDHPSAVALTQFLAGELALVTVAAPAPIAARSAALPDDDDDADGEDGAENAMLARLERKLIHAGY